jgi:tetratricopeptide (TPR) repeat protein
MADYDEVLRLDPTHAGAFRGRGNLWLRKGEYDKAISDYSEAIRLNPKDYLAYVNRAGTWENKQEYDKAISDYGEAIRLNPSDSLAYEGRAGTWKERGDYDKAINDYTQAIKINPNSFNYSLRGELWADQKVYDKAIRDFRDAIRIDPDSPFAYADFAWILATCPDATYRNGTKAVEYAKKADELDVTGELPWEEVIAAAYAEAGDFDEAVKWQQKYIDYCSSDSDFAGLVEEANEVLQLYRQKKPYRDEG